MPKSRDEDHRRADADRTVKLTWKDISDADLRTALTRAKSGADPGAAMQLIEYFHRRIRDNLPYDRTILFEYLEHAFGRIVDGEQPDRAFGFKQGAGEK